jgi:hypothetical protein
MQFLLKKFKGNDADLKFCLPSRYYVKKCLKNNVENIKEIIRNEGFALAKEHHALSIDIDHWHNSAFSTEEHSKFLGINLNCRDETNMMTTMPIAFFPTKNSTNALTVSLFSEVLKVGNKICP